MRRLSILFDVIVLTKVQFVNENDNAALVPCMVYVVALCPSVNLVFATSGCIHRVTLLF